MFQRINSRVLHFHIWTCCAVAIITDSDSDYQCIFCRNDTRHSEFLFLNQGLLVLNYFFSCMMSNLAYPASFGASSQRPVQRCSQTDKTKEALQFLEKQTHMECEFYTFTFGPAVAIIPRYRCISGIDAKNCILASGMTRFSS